MNDAIPESDHPRYTLPPDYPCSPEEREEIEHWMNKPVSPAILAAEGAFRKELPELLKTHRGQWVAYSGSERLGIDPSHPSLYQKCLEQGLAPGQISMKYIDPPLDPDDLVV
jgi:hypothetical protein